MKANPFTNPPVAAEVTRRTREPITAPVTHLAARFWTAVTESAKSPLWRRRHTTNPDLKPSSHPSKAATAPPPCRRSPKRWRGLGQTLPGSGAHGVRTFNLSILLELFAAATLFTQAAIAAKPPPPPPQPSSGTLVLSYPNASSWGLAASPSGTIFSVGNTYTTWSQLVLGTSDSGSSWSVLDDFAPPGRHVDFFGWADLGGGITSDPAGNLYVSGLSYPDESGNADAQWYVRRSTDGGGDVDDR